MRGKKLGNKEFKTLRRKSSWLLVALIIMGTLFAITNLEPAFSTFTSRASARATFSTGTWGQPGPKVCKVCPCYGISGMCAWAVFLNGSKLGQVSGVKLVKGSTIVSAKKIWHIGDGILYCVFDLRKVPTGSYDILAKTAVGQETVVYKGFKVIGLGGCGVGELWAATQPATTAEDPLDFKLTVKNDDPASFVANVQGPVRSKFITASLVTSGIRVDGTVDSITRTGCRVKFARANVPLGTYDLTINRVDNSSLLLENSFAAQQYVSPMQVQSIQPTSGTQGQKVQVKVNGQRLDLANGVALVQGGKVIQPAKPVRASATQLVVVFDLNGAQPGLCDLYVSCVDGTQRVLGGCFNVIQRKAAPTTQTPSSQPTDQPAQQSAPTPAPATAPGPVIIDVTPRSCRSETEVQFQVAGCNLRSDARFKLVGGGWWGWSLGVRLESEAKLECLFDLTGVPAGAYQFVIVEPDGSKQTFAKPIEVLPAARQASASR